ncbi:MAG: molecular chaperone DnaJ [Nanoarchaeota archaeon]
MAEKDYYKILGVSKDAGKEEIRKAYKKLAKKYHPDLNRDNPEAEQKFKDINEAVSVLSDDTKRQQYEQFGSEGMKQGAGSAGGGFGGFAGGFGGMHEGFDINDIFESFFGGGSGFRRSGGRRSGPQQGADLRYDMEITLEQAATGIDKDIRLKKDDICDKCDGKGGFGEETCSNCGGYGVVEQVQKTPFGMFRSQRPCSFCRGLGKVVRESCDECHGNGYVRKTKTIKIKIPAGVESGVRLRVEGEGEPGEPGAPQGDLYVFITVSEHEEFERKDDDVYLTVPITFTQAVLGDTIKVPTITGKAQLKVPAGTQPGTLLRMKGKGMPHMRGSGNGDQYVKITIEVPKTLSKKQKELITQFEKDSSSKKPHLRFFEKLKGM